VSGSHSVTIEWTALAPSAATMGEVQVNGGPLAAVQSFIEVRSLPVSINATAG
jgi:hypothetical protein